jgi:hypothetical protein
MILRIATQNILDGANFRIKRTKKVPNKALFFMPYCMIANEQCDKIKATV